MPHFQHELLINNYVGMKRKYTDEQLRISVQQNYTLQQVLDSLNLIGGHARIKAKILDLKLDISHWTSFTYSKPRKIQPLTEILKDGIFLQTSNLKSRLLNNEYFTYECSVCKISEWNGKSISLQLDHINGKRRDNRLENLRLLCPNCHSQTDTFCGKNQKGTKRKKEGEYIRYLCIKCEKPLLRYQNKLKMCTSCRKTEYSGKLSQNQLAEFYIDYNSGNFTTNEICSKYQISETTIYNLLKRRSK